MGRGEWVGFGWLLPANTEPAAGTAMEFPSEVPVWETAP